MKKSIILAILFFAVIQTQAQHLAGYLGRQVTVFGNFKSFFRHREGTKEKQIPLNTKLGGGVDFVVSKWTSIGFEYETFRTGFKTDLPYLNDNYSSYSIISYANTLLGCNVQTYGVYLNLFSGQKGHLAPYGKYQVLGLKLLNITEKDYGNGLETYNNEHNMHIRDPETSTYAYGMTYGVGKKWIYFDRLILDLRLQSCLVLNKNFLPGVFNRNTTRKSNTSYNSYNNETNADFTLSLEEDMVRRVALHSFLDLSVGIGWLLF